MSEPVKAATIVAVAIVVAAAVWVYFSPYQTCLREFAARGNDNPAFVCGRLLGSASR